MKLLLGIILGIAAVVLVFVGLIAGLDPEGRGGRILGSCWLAAAACIAIIVAMVLK